MKFAGMAAAAALICAPLSAQAELNRLNVAVIDRQGEPVTGLQRSDFRLLEDGKPQAIAFFRFTGDQPIQSNQHGQAVSRGVCSNRTTAPPLYTVVLIDLLNDRLTGGMAIGEEVARLLKDLKPSKSLYIYFLTPSGGLYPLHPIPNPNTAPTQNEAEWTQDLARTVQSALKTLITFKQVDDRNLKARFDLTVHALQEIGTRMELIPGRKNLVWATRGFPQYVYLSNSDDAPADFAEPFRVICEFLANQQIVVYPVEESPRGADSMDGARAQTLDDFWRLTGGRRFGSGGVGEAVRQATADSSANYEIAYYSSSIEKRDGKYHQLHLSCSRKDVRLQVASGFYALLTPSTREALERKELELALRSPFDAGEIGLRASVLPDLDQPGNLRFEVSVNAPDLLLTQGKDLRTGKLDLLFGVYGSSGLQQPERTVSYAHLVSGAPGSPTSLDISVTPEQYQSDGCDGIVIRKSIPVGADVRRVRVIVVDRELGAAGSITIPIER
jgi:VWFA-related protein